MPLTHLPTKTEESLGIVKQDVLPYTDPETQVPAVQYERLKDAVIANATAIGLDDGSTPDSIVARFSGLSMQAAYDKGSQIDTSAGQPVALKTNGNKLELAGNKVDASDTLEVRAAGSAAGALDLHASHPTGGIRLLIEQQVRLILRHDGASQYRLVPGAKAGTSLGTEGTYFDETCSAGVKTFELTQLEDDQSLVVLGRAMTGSSPSVRVANKSAFSGSTSEQRAFEVAATGNQTGNASLVVADLVLDGTVGKGGGTILRARYASSSLLTVTSSQVQVAAGVASAPGLSVLGDDDTGLYSPGANALGLATNGVSRVTIDTATMTSTLPVAAPSGAKLTPSFTFAGDLDTGLYRGGANTLGLVVGGTEAATLETSRLTTAVPLRAADGSVSAPTYSFSADATTGFYLAGTGTVGVSVSGVQALAVGTTSIAASKPIYASNGTVSAPSYSLTSDTDTGLYAVGANQLGVAAGGTQVGVFVSAGSTKSYLKMANGNLATGDVPVSNALYAKNVPKAWLKATGTSTVDDGFGIASIASDGGSPAGVTVTFSMSATAASQQAIVSSAAGTTATTAKWHTVDNITVNSCRVRAWAWTGNAIAQVAVTGDWSLLRFANVS